MKGEDIVVLLRAVYFAISVLIIWEVTTIVPEISRLNEAKKTRGVVIGVIVLIALLAALLICISNFIYTF